MRVIYQKTIDGLCMLTNMRTILALYIQIIQWLVHLHWSARKMGRKAYCVSVLWNRSHSLILTNLFLRRRKSLLIVRIYCHLPLLLFCRRFRPLDNPFLLIRCLEDGPGLHAAGPRDLQPQEEDCEAQIPNSTSLLKFYNFNPSLRNNISRKEENSE